MPSPSLAQLKARIAALEGFGRDAGAGSIPLGVPEIDEVLPWKGLSLGCLHELSPAPERDGTVGAAIGFAAVLLGRLAAGRNRPVLWLVQGEMPYAPGLTALSLTPERLLLARPARPAETLWALEEGARCPGLAAVLGEVWGLDLTAARRLQLAARASGTAVLLLNRGAGIGTASSRWRIGPAPSDAPAAEGVGSWRWRVDLTRCRGRGVGEDGNVAAWTVEWNDETHGLRVAAPAGDRPAVAPRSRAAG